MALPQIDFTSSPLPANGQARSAAGLAAIYNNIATVYNAMAVAATNGNDVNSVAVRDASGGIQFTYVGLIPVAGAAAAINITAPTGYTGAPLTFTVNGVSKIVSSAAGDMTLAGQLSAASAAVSGTSAFAGTSTFNGAAVFNGAVTLNTGLFAALISDYRPTTSVTAGHISVLAGGALSDSGGNQIGPVGSPLDLNIVGTIPQPGGSNSVYLALSIPVGWNGTAANLVAAIVASTAAATPTKPTMPSGNIPLGWLLWRGPTASAGSGANAAGVFLAADITDARFGGGGSGSGGSGTTDANLRTAPFLLYGTSAYASAGYDMSVSQGTAFIHNANIKSAAGRASALDLNRNVLSPDIIARVSSGIGANTVTVAATASQAAGQPGPLTVSVNGVAYTVTSPLTTTNTNTATTGTRYVIADVSTGALTLVSPMPTTNTTSNATQVCLGFVPFDAVSGVLKQTYVDFTALANLRSTQMSLQREQITVPSGAFSTALGILTAPTGISPVSVWIPPGYIAKVTNEMEVTLASSGGTGRLDMWATVVNATGTQNVAHLYTTRCAVGAGIDQLLTRTAPTVQLFEGLNTFSAQGYTDATTTTATITTFIITIEIYKKGYS